MHCKQSSKNLCTSLECEPVCQASTFFFSFMWAKGLLLLLSFSIFQDIDKEVDSVTPCFLLMDFKKSNTFTSQPSLITSMSLDDRCCTHASHCTTSLPNANTGPGLPVIISTLSKAEENAMCDRFLGAYNCLEAECHFACCFYDSRNRPHDNWDTETFWTAAPTHPAGP